MFEIPKQSNNLADALAHAFEMIECHRDQFITPEHLLWGIAWQRQYMKAIPGSQTSDMLIPYLEKCACPVPKDKEYNGPQPSVQFVEMVNHAFKNMALSNAEQLDVPHILHGMLSLTDSYAHDVLEYVCQGNTAELMSQIVEYYSDKSLEYRPEEITHYIPYYDDFPEEEMPASDFLNEDTSWRQYVTCLNDMVDSHNPLIGRDQELQRTIQVLCRKDKNNPLHVGEAGVGKTAIAYGLTAMIERGEVPERISGSRVYQLDLGSLIAGTQYRGEFEKRIKAVLEGISNQGKAILYVDEIHNIIGAGRVDGSTLDASNILKPYLEQGTIRFMGATTYDEYSKAFVHSKAFARRFEKIDIAEPTVDQCRLILQGLKDRYEQYHNVVYTDEAIDFAVTGAAKYITGRYLPDKAIDLIDEAGAWRVMHPIPDAEVQTIDRQLIADVLAHVCHVDTLAEKEDDKQQLKHLDERLKAMVYGQDHAIRQVSEAVMLGSAGLIDDNKPLASLLFVGPTGVGKTEVARVLADTLGLPLLRFDMSEYAEKHTVAKLIGSPAGYVGYDDGGLLTDAIRKSPHCVLLFDELEKAHDDIYNILLQVMDYAMLTDNKGQKADFRHVIFIMTTNSGAQYAHQANLGFVKGRTAGEAMLKSVKQTFKPEFLNRLTDITVFNDMDRTMAALVLEKKLKTLRAKLDAKGVTLHLDDEAMQWLLDHGFSAEYGGREIERVVNSNLKPLLMREMLFGVLKGGGEAHITVDSDKLTLTMHK